MARICEVCGRIDEIQEDDFEHDLLDVCSVCTHERQQFFDGDNHYQ